MHPVYAVGPAAARGRRRGTCRASPWRDNVWCTNHWYDSSTMTNGDATRSSTSTAAGSATLVERMNARLRPYIGGAQLGLRDEAPLVAPDHGGVCPLCRPPDGRARRRPLRPAHDAALPDGRRRDERRGPRLRAGRRCRSLGVDAGRRPARSAGRPARAGEPDLLRPVGRVPQRGLRLPSRARADGADAPAVPRDARPVGAAAAGAPRPGRAAAARPRHAVAAGQAARGAGPGHSRAQRRRRTSAAHRADGRRGAPSASRPSRSPSG